MIGKLSVGLFVIFCFACDVPEVVLDPVPIYGPSDTMYWPQYGQVNALKNGWEWTANATASKFYSEVAKEKRMYIWFNSFIEGIDEREELVIGPVKFSPGIYSIGDRKSFPFHLPVTNVTTVFHATVKSDGDVFEDLYLVDTRSTVSFFAITYVDTIENIVRGSFDMTFRLVQPQDNPRNPKTVTFSAGHFEAQFRN